MKTILSLILSIFFFNFIPYAQQPPNFLWSRDLGGALDEEARSIAIDFAGNVYTTGHFQGSVDFDPGPGVFNLTSVGGTDIFITKHDTGGNLIWAKRIGANSDDMAFGIALDAAGNVHITGFFQQAVDFDPNVGVYLIYPKGNWDSFVLKLDPFGDFIWAKQFGGTNNEVGFSIVVDDFGNVITTGSFAGTTDFYPGTGVVSLTSAGGTDIYVAKLSISGAFVWARRLGGIANDQGFSLAVDNNNNIYTTGFFYGTGDFDPGAGVFNLSSSGLSDVFLSKLSPAGEFIWAKNLGGDGFSEGSSIKVDENGNIYSTGYFMGMADFDPGSDTFNLTSIGDADLFLSKLDQSGEFVWAKQFGGPGDDRGYGLAIDSDGNIFSAGTFQATAEIELVDSTSTTLTSNGGYEIFTSKCNPSGEFIWAASMGGSMDDNSFSIAVDVEENVYLTGFFQGTADFDPSSATYNLTANNSDIFIEKFCQLATPTITTNGPITICQGDSVILSSSAAYSYLWSTGAITQSIIVKTSGDYSVTITNVNGCPAYSNTVTVVAVPDPPPTATITPDGPTAICPNEEVTLVANDCIGCTYLWSNGESTQSILASPTTDTQYWVTVSNAAGCSTQSDPITITVLPAPIATIIPGGSTTFCLGDSVTLLADPCIGCTYYWSTDEIKVSIVVSPDETTAFTLEVTNEDGCTAVSDPVLINILPLPNITVMGVSTICEGMSTILTASGANSYNWSPQGGLSNPNIPSPEATPASTTTYTVSGTGTNGCIDTANITVTVNPNPDVAIDGVDMVCAGNSSTMVASGAETYTWSPASVLNNPGIPNPTTDPLSETTTFTVIGTMNSCSDTAEFTIEVIPLPDILITGPSFLCLGDSIQLIATGADLYQWSPTNTVSDPDAANPYVFPEVTTTYSITGIKNGCSNTVSKTIVVNPVPDVLVLGATAICAGDSTLLSAYGANEYQWMPVGSLSDPNIPNPWANPVITTTYIVTGNLNGCTDTAQATITVNPTPVVLVAPSNATICQGESIELNAFGAFSYTWSPALGLSDPGVSDPTATPIETVSYVVTGYLGQCSNSDTVLIVVEMMPTPSEMILGDTVACSGDTLEYSVEDIGQGTFYSWMLPPGWAGSSTANSITTILGDLGGVISVTAGNQCGESDPTNLSVIVNPTPEKPVISIMGDTLFSNYDNGVHSWYLNGELLSTCTTQMCIASSSGEYQVVVDQGGCTSPISDPILVVGIDQPADKHSLTIFPNPTSGILSVSGKGFPNGDYVLALSNALGQVVGKMHLSIAQNILEYQMDLTPLPAGVYFLTFRSEWKNSTFMVNRVK